MRSCNNSLRYNWAALWPVSSNGPTTVSGPNRRFSTSLLHRGYPGHLACSVPWVVRIGGSANHLDLGRFVRLAATALRQCDGANGGNDSIISRLA